MVDPGLFKGEKDADKYFGAWEDMEHDPKNVP